MVEYVYDSNGRMMQIKAHAAGDGLTYIEERVWGLAYNGDETWPVQISDPSGFVMDIGYDLPDPDPAPFFSPHTPNGRITSLSDMRGLEDPAHTYQYRYYYQYRYPSDTSEGSNEIAQVTDPEPESALPLNGLSQRFSTTCWEDSYIDVKYTDRRGEIWKYQASGVRDPVNGPLLRIENPLLQRDTFTFNAERMMTSYMDARNNIGWDYTYDDNGNMLTMTSSATTLTRTWTYDALNNLTSRIGRGTPRPTPTLWRATPRS